MLCPSLIVHRVFSATFDKLSKRLLSSAFTVFQRQISCFPGSASLLQAVEGAGPCGALTGAVAELEAQVGAAEAVDGDGQFDDLPPARAVVVVQHEGVVGAPAGLPRAQADAVLPPRETTQH